MNDVLPAVVDTCRLLPDILEDLSSSPRFSAAMYLNRVGDTIGKGYGNRPVERDSSPAWDRPVA